MAKTGVYYYPKKEEKVNIITHGFGFVMSFFATVLLLRKAVLLDSSLHFWSYLVYGLSLMVLYFASTVYHSATSDVNRYRLNIFDHSAIYVLIAGTYVPYALIGMGGNIGTGLVVAVWIIAILGIIFKIFFIGRFRIASTIGYVLMGCVIAFVSPYLVETMSPSAIAYLLWGGVSYIVGAILFSFERIPYNHAIFHIFVLLGSLLHFLGVYLHL